MFDSCLGERSFILRTIRNYDIAQSNDGFVKTPYGAKEKMLSKHYVVASSCNYIVMNDKVHGKNLILTIW